MGRIIRAHQYDRLLAKAQEREAKERVKAQQQGKNSRPRRVAPIKALLQKTADSWAFGSERALEDFVYENLQPLLGLTPLERQYNLAGDICDILAIATFLRILAL